MIPEFLKVRAIVVERVGFPGMLGVAVRPGSGKVCPLPPGYDMHTRVNVDKQGWVLVMHPKLPPLLCNPTEGSTNPITGPINPKDITAPTAINERPLILDPKPSKGLIHVD